MDLHPAREGAPTRLDVLRGFQSQKGEHRSIWVPTEVEPERWVLSDIAPHLSGRAVVNYGSKGHFPAWAALAPPQSFVRAGEAARGAPD